MSEASVNQDSNEVQETQGGWIPQPLTCRCSELANKVGVLQDGVDNAINLLVEVRSSSAAQILYLEAKLKQTQGIMALPPKKRWIPKFCAMCVEYDHNEETCEVVKKAFTPSYGKDPWREDRIKKTDVPSTSKLVICIESDESN